MPDIRVWVHDEDWPDGHDPRDHVIGGVERRNLKGCFASVDKRLHVPDLGDDYVPTRERFRFSTGADMIDAPALPHDVENIIIENGVSVLAGAPGCGKSFAGDTIALCMAAGKPFMGRKVREGPVVLVPGEGLGGKSARWRAALSEWDADDRARALSKLFVVADAPRLHDASDTAAFVSAIAALDERPRLVILDTLARCMPGGDENSAQDVGKFIQGVDRIRELGCSVLILHHTTKDGSIERGSSALRGAADVLCFVKLRDGIVTIEVDKARDFEPPKPMTLRLVPEGDSVRLEPLDHQGFAAKAQGAAVVAVLRKANGAWVPFKAICEACKGKSLASIERYVKALHEAGAIQQRKVGKTTEYRLAQKAGGAA